MQAWTFSQRYVPELILVSVPWLGGTQHAGQSFWMA